MPKCDFNKVAWKLYWNPTSAWVFFCKFGKPYRKTPVLESLFWQNCRPEGLQFYQKETPTQVLSIEICEIFKNTHFEKDQRTNVFVLYMIPSMAKNVDPPTHCILQLNRFYLDLKFLTLKFVSLIDIGYFQNILACYPANALFIVLLKNTMTIFWPITLDLWKQQSVKIVQRYCETTHSSWNKIRRDRSSRSQMFFKISGFRNFAIFN